MAEKMKCKIVTFNEVYEMVKKVSDAIKRSGYEPTTIIGLARGAWIPARLMCDFMGITDLISLKVEHWLQTGKTKDEATIRYPLTANLHGKKLLVIDDITDTGKSLVTSTKYLRTFNPEEIRVATMQYIPQSKFRPDYFAEEVKVWTWFIYPWNWIEDTSTLIVRLIESENGKSWSLQDISGGLKKFFEIDWERTMLQQIVDLMVEREQIKAVEMGKTYKLKKKRVIEL